MSAVAPPPRAAFALLIVAALLHGLSYMAALPPWMGEDEPWQYEYAHHIADGRLPWGGVAISGSSPDKLDDRTIMSLSQLQVWRRIGGVTKEELSAVQREILDSMRARHFWERVPFAGWGPGTDTFDQIATASTATHQPPPYFLLTGGLLWASGLQGVEARLWALRAFSLLCYLAVVIAAFHVGRCVSNDDWIALGCALFVAWLPMHARQAAVVNNDVLAKLLASLAILFGVRVLAGRGSWGSLAAMLAFVGLGLWTKTSTAGALAVVVPALAWKLRVRLGTRRGVALGVVALALFAAAAALYWYGSHNPALPRRLSNLEFRIGRALSPELWLGLGRTFAGSFRWETAFLPAAAYAAMGAGMALALCGALVALLRKTSAVDRRVLWVCAAAVLLQLLIIGLRGTAKGRYLFPLLPALGALVSVGVLGPFRPSWRPLVFGLLVIAMVAYDAAFLWRGLFWSYYGSWGS